MDILSGDEFSIIIPTYHEAKNIPALIQEIAQVNFKHKTFEVILVDDDSQDGTMEIVEQLRSQYAWLKVIHRQKKRSLSHSILDGLKSSCYPFLVIMDADLSHPPHKIPEMLNYLADQQVDMVIGSRYISGGSSDESWPLARKVLSKTAAWAARRFLSIQAKDPLSGFIAFRKATCFADELQPISWKIGLEIIVKCNYKHIQEVPIRFSKRRYGSSKLTFKVAFDCWRHVLKLMRLSKHRSPKPELGSGL